MASSSSSSMAMAMEVEVEVEAEAVVSVVIQKLSDMVEEPVTHDKKVVEQLKSIKQSVGGIRGFLTEENKEEVVRLVYQVENEIEKLALRIRRRKTLGFFINQALFFNARRELFRIRSTVKKLNLHNPNGVGDAERGGEPHDSTPKKLTFSYSRNEEERSISVNQQPLIVGYREERLRYPKQMSSFSYEEQELGIFGLKQDVDDLVSRLCSAETGEPVLPIVGNVGSGKTTLARAIYRSTQIKQWFQGLAWVSLLHGYTTSDILESLLEKVDKSIDQGVVIPDKLSKEDKLCYLLKQKKYLVVMDDLPLQNAHELKHVFGFGDSKPQSASKLIFTTCDASNGLEIVGLNPHYMKPLDEQDSWDMFLKKAAQEKNTSLKPDGLKQNILGICNGLPLNIVLVGGLLSTIEEDMWSSVEFSGSNCSNVWSLSYNSLSSQMKLCLLYLVLFPKHYDISVRRLLRLWPAEGFVKQDEVQNYFNYLVNQNLIQISKLRSDNSPRKCRLLGIIHDKLLPKAQAISLFYVDRNINDHSETAEGPFGIRRFVEYGGVDFNNFLQDDPSKLGLLRSYLSFNFQKKDTPAKYIGRFVGKIIDNGRFGLLRVLDLEGVYKPSLPENLGNLFNLRYLGLRWTFLDTLPPTVGNLPYLETLDVKHTNISILPNSIWKMKHLRHLNLNEIRLDMPKHQHSSLTLLTLWGLYVDKKSRVSNGLYSLAKLRELGISFHLESEQEDLFGWIANLEALQSLRLRSKDDMGRPWELKLKPLPKLVNLSHLNLLGSLQSLPCQPDLPPNLKVLTLSVSQLKEDPMPTLGQLQSLTVLRLLANSYTGRKIECRGFGKLRVLKLWMLRQLEEWEVAEGAMENIKELNIRCCDRLKNIPPILLNRTTFEELILTNMPTELTVDAQQRKLSHTSLTVNTDWKFEPLPWEHDDINLSRDAECNGGGGPSVMQSVARDVEPTSYRDRDSYGGDPLVIQSVATNVKPVLSRCSGSPLQFIKGNGKEKLEDGTTSYEDRGCSGGDPSVTQSVTSVVKPRPSGGYSVQVFFIFLFFILFFRFKSWGGRGGGGET